MLNTADYKVLSGENFKLKSFSTDDTDGFTDKNEVKLLTEDNILKMASLQDKLYADGSKSLLIIIQAMDAAGKDGIIKHVMKGINPQGTKVTSFKQPSTEERAHDYLWRCSKALPERGTIGIFNRSYYEDVLVVRVHNIINAAYYPNNSNGKSIWEERFEQIRNFEKHLNQNGTKVIKIFLNLSKEEQKKRFLARIDDPTKNWKFSDADLKERTYWDEYQNVYEEAIKETATKSSPWYIIPADKKWFARYLASEIINEHLEDLKPQYPVVSPQQIIKLQEAKIALLAEN